MDQLTRDSFDKAVGYVERHARPIDRALLAHLFTGGPVEAVIDAAAAYQNDDGGFGRAIEPDFRVPDSSVTATTVAFQYLVAVDAPADHEVVRRGIAYLRATYDAVARAWPPVCPRIVDHPRAGWWEFYPAMAFDPSSGQWGNPNAEAIGYLRRYRALLDEAWVAERVADATAWLTTVEKPEAHALSCGLRFAESLDGEAYAIAMRRVAELAVGVVTGDAASWAEYGPQPVWYARSPDSPVTRAFGDRVVENLRFVIATQSADGSWQPTWAWGRYEDDWPTAKAEWAGHLTVANLRLLADFDAVA